MYKKNIHFFSVFLVQKKKFDQFPILCAVYWVNKCVNHKIQTHYVNLLLTQKLTNLILAFPQNPSKNYDISNYLTLIRNNCNEGIHIVLKEHEALLICQHWYLSTPENIP